MPTYEFRCLDCSCRFEIFLTYEAYGKEEIHCTHCGSSSIQRKIGRIRVSRSEEDRLNSLADPMALDALEDDPKTLGRMMREMSSEVGEELGPEFDEVVDRLEKGQSPEEIEQALPDLGLDDNGGG